MISQKLLSRISGRLPVPSVSLQKIFGVLRSPDASATDIADAIKLDPSLSAKVLRLANSAYIGLPRAVSSVHHAVVLLGIRRIHSLVITCELLSPCRDLALFPFSIDRFRTHSVIVAFIAEAIGKHLRRYYYIDERELFSGALLHDIGKLLAAVAEPDTVEEIHIRSRGLSIPFYRAENDSFSHTVFGQYLAEVWGLPLELAACIRGHHTAFCFPEYHRLVSIVHVADVMAHLIGYSVYEDEVTPAIDDAALSEIDLPVERLRVIADEILAHEDQISSLLEIL